MTAATQLLHISDASRALVAKPSVLMSLLPQGYGWVLFLVVFYSLQLFLKGYAAMGVRSKFLTKQFFEKNFPEELKSGEIDVKEGYPDTGNGLYCHKLKHSEWKEINVAQRIHLNMLEQHAPIAFFMLIAGLTFTQITVIAQIWCIIGRFAYQACYLKGGPKARAIPVMVFLLPSHFALLGLAFTSAYCLGGGCEGFLSLILQKPW